MPMPVTIASDLSARVPFLSLGILSVNGLTVRARDEGLWQQLSQSASAFAARANVTALASDPRGTAVRRMFKAAGIDPTRYRPSSEALVRRVTQGKGLYRINTAVDVNNWVSLEERLPLGIYDAGRIAGGVLLRLGRENEVYEGIGKSLLALEGKMVLADDQGAFGSPISDSTRAMVAEQTRDVTVVVFAPDVPHADLLRILNTTAERLVQYNGGQPGQMEIVVPNVAP
jgi:DNA/RNA-binding domain of Phe-tRNA-synthetase-like protein